MHRAARTALAAVTLGGAAAAVAQRRLVRSIEADPEHAALSRPLQGEAATVRAGDGTELHVEEFGPAEAPKLVLVHGWMCALRFWRYQIEELARDFRVVAYDSRGHAASAEADDYSFDAFADDLDAVLEDRLSGGERAVVAGHSMGAMTLAAWAGRHPERVRERLAGCVMVNTGLGDLVTESLVLRTPERLGLREPLGRLFLTAQLPARRGPSPLGDAIVRHLALSSGAGPARVAFCREMVASCNPRVRGAAGSAMSRMDLWHALEHLDVPALVIAGSVDRLTPPVHARRLARTIPGEVELVELPQIGHMAPIEAPEEVNRRIRELAVRALAADGGAKEPPRVHAPATSSAG